MTRPHCKTLLVLDPGLQERAGHDYSAAAELKEAVEAAGHRIRVCACRSFAPSAAHPTDSVIEPVFTLGTYDGRLGDGSILGTPAGLEQAVALCARELHGVDLTGVELVLMNTCSPVHLIALERVFATRSAVPRLALGLILPLSYWARSPASWALLGGRFRQALDALADQTPCVYYNETGELELPGLRIEIPVLLQPIAGSTAQHVRRLLGRPPRPAGAPVRLGFLGPPFWTKGFGLIADALAAWPAALHDRARFTFQLPAGHEVLAAQLAGLGPHVEAVSRETSNAEFFEALSRVDAVLCLYDAAAYAARLSGITVEAAAVGTPVVVSEGALAMRRFLNRYAPLSYLTAAYRADELIRLAGLPPETWSGLAARARHSAELVLQAKSASRFLAAIGFL